MKVLHVVPSFYPATYWGGPIWSTKSICDGIAARSDFNLRVLTTDAASPARDDCVVPADLSYPVHYARRIAGDAFAPGMLTALPKAVVSADLVHLTGVYSPPTLPVLAMCRLFRRPLVWSPRGALQATAEWSDVPHRSAKRGFERAASALLPKQTCFHVTAQAEADAGEAIFPTVPSRLIPNAVAVPRCVPDKPPSEGLRLMFLGRLHPKKGLELLIAAMRDLPASTRLDVYGDGASDYVYALRQIAKATGRNIVFHGAVSGDAKTCAFVGADLFVLPSYSENFGIAVAEALAHGVPVLTTDATPWAGLVQHGCGRMMSLDHDSLADEVMALAAQDLPAMGARGREWMRRDFGANAMVSKFAALYQSMAPAGVSMVTA